MTEGDSEQSDDPQCIVCEKSDETLRWTQFTDGTEGPICESCEGRILDEHGVGPVE